MSRKDYELIADVLRTEAEAWPPDHPEQSHLAALRIAFMDALAQNSPAFDGNRFLLAAQPRPDAYSQRIERLRNTPPSEYHGPSFADGE